jgi:hypothetical protein
LFLSILIDETVNIFVGVNAHLNGFLFAICGKLAPFGLSLRSRHKFKSTRQGIFDHLVDHRFEARVVGVIERDALPVLFNRQVNPVRRHQPLERRKQEVGF